MACISISFSSNIQSLRSANSSLPKVPIINTNKSIISNTVSSSFNKKKGFILFREGVHTVRSSIDRVELDENPEGIISGEWPENFSLLTYEDVRAYLEPEIFKEKMKPSARLGDVMSAVTRTATIDQTLEEIDHHFEVVSGLPVINGDHVCIGVISKKDKERAANGLKSKVGELMSSPAITLSPDGSVLDAAALMLKEKIHRIPIVNEGGQFVGIVTRTDIFTALERLPA